MKTRSGIAKIWLAVAALIIAAFVGGFVISAYVGAGNNGVLNISDKYPYGECLGSCPEHAFPVSDVVQVSVIRFGEVIDYSVQSNLITNAGEDVISRQTACGATGAPACADGGVYIALSTDSTATAATDTTCPSEIVGNGLSRTLGTYSHTTGTNQHEISATFTYTGAVPVTVAKVCMFDAASGGDLFAETLLSSTATVSANGDQLTINWTFTH